MTDVTKYDLTKREDVRRLGEDIGRSASLELVPLVRTLDADQQFIFFACYLAAFAGSMAAAGGVELSLAVLDRIKEAVPGAVSAEQAKMN